MIFVYSGKCRLGLCGQETGLKDFCEKPLFVGDIVITCCADKYGVSDIHSLTVVVSDRYQSYIGAKIETEHRENTGKIKYFVMGIANVDFMNSDTWVVRKLKDYKDVINGEHWPEYGFNYSTD